MKVMRFIVLSLVVLSGSLRAADRPPDSAQGKPNILWISCEDISPDLGSYGVPHASTPNLDRFAQQSVRYTAAFAPIGVCAPARSCIITGMYPSSIGTQHMRCNGKLPDNIKCFSQNLRDAGYYCTNNSKTDYNFKPPKEAWDESSNKAHWRNRKPGQPFFAVFNLGSTHESQTWGIKPEELSRRRAALKPEQLHDPAKTPIPPYHPDAPEVRNDWAIYHDNISYMDLEAANLLKQLEADGLAEDTIVFFFSDHGAGMPRSKRWLYESSLRVPFIVRFPKKYENDSPGAPGTTTDRLISFVDLAPTMLSLCGVEIPQHLQGKPFLGPRKVEPRDYIYGFRDRMDERYDMVRCVRDARYKYIRNYYPDKPYFLSQHLYYSMNKPTHRVWEQWAREGKLNDVQQIWMRDVKPVEELYDTQSDPWEISNLAAMPEHKETLERLRKVHLDWVLETRDLGFLPEAEMRMRAKGTTEYDWARSEGQYNLTRIVETALLLDKPRVSQEIYARLKDPDAAVRYWALVGLIHKSKTAPTDWVAQVRGMMESDPSWDVRITAAELLSRWGKFDGVIATLERSLAHENEFVRLRGANLADDLNDKARELLPLMKEKLKDPSEYVQRVMEHAVKELEK